MSSDHRKKTSITLTGEAIRLLGLLAVSNGVSKSAVIELAIREKAKREGVE